MRPLEMASLLCLIAAVSALTMRAASPRVRRALLGVTIVTFQLEDPAREDSRAPGRPRRLMVQAWYPADTSTAQAPREPYWPDVTRTGPALAHKLGLPSFFASHFAYAVSHSHDHAPFAPSLGRVPVIVFSHGSGGVRAQNTSTLEVLASHGYMVASLDHAAWDLRALAGGLDRGRGLPGRCPLQRVCQP